MTSNQEATIISKLEERESPKKLRKSKFEQIKIMFTM
jgi:hypothetical protein